MGRRQAINRFQGPLSTWFPDTAGLTRFRRGRLGRAPAVLRPRDAAWRTIAPDFAGARRLAATGFPFHVVGDGRADRASSRRRLASALAAGHTVFLPQVHQVLPRLARLMVTLRVALLGPRPEECSFLFLVEGQGRPGMGLHHDGEVDGFWLQLEGRRTVTFGPPVAPGTPLELQPGAPRRRRGWRTVDLTPGTLFYLPPRTPHDVVCYRRSLALSLTWRRRRRGARAADRATLAAWDVVSGRVDRVPPLRRARLWIQVPAVAGQLDRGRRRRALYTPDGVLWLPGRARALASRLGLMPSFPPRALPTRWLAALVEHGMVARHDLPRLIIPDDPAALDGWRF